MPAPVKLIMLNGLTGACKAGIVSDAGASPTCSLGTTDHWRSSWDVHGISHSNPLNNQRNTLPDANTHGAQRVFAFDGFQLIQSRRYQSRPARA